MADESRDLWEELDRLGIEEVRRKLAMKVYGENKLPLVQEWIAHQERLSAKAESERVASLMSEQTRIASEQVSIASEQRSMARRFERRARDANRIAITAIIAMIVVAVTNIIIFLLL